MTQQQQHHQQVPQATIEKILSLTRSLHERTTGEEAADGTFEVCLNTLLDVITNLIENPLDERFNTIDSRDQVFIEKVSFFYLCCCFLNL